MGNRYRSWEERREIIRSVIADSNPRPLASFGLSESERVFFSARAARAVEQLARKTSAFKAYYKLPIAKPFAFVVAISALVVSAAAGAGVFIFLRTRDDPAYPIYAALISLAVVATGWAVSGWLSHRNTIRQNTNNMLFARFAQSAFGDAMHRFHRQFGYDVTQKITRAHTRALTDSGDDDKWKAATAVGYLLNYFEFIAAGVLRGDLDQRIINDNIRGVICYYYDMCEPYILEGNRRNPKIFEHLIKIRTHYREP